MIQRLGIKRNEVGQSLCRVTGVCSIVIFFLLCVIRERTKFCAKKQSALRKILLP